MNIEYKYEVTPENREKEYQKALDRVMKHFILSNCKSEEPMFILAGGQPGSGKTALISTIKQQHPDLSFVVIDLDDYRKYHPDFEEIKNKHKKDGVLLTNSFAFSIENHMLAYAISHKMNVINVSTLRNTKMIQKSIMQNIKPSGFKVEAYVLAVSPDESYCSTLQRYKEQQKNPNCIPRFTEKEFHDLSYQNLDLTIKQLESMNIPITICKRASKKDKPALIVYYKNLKNSLFLVKKIRQEKK